MHKPRRGAAWAGSLRRGTLGGDHSIALGSVTGAARSRTLGLVWLDAHGDFNTDETSPSGNVHGMPLAVVCPWTGAVAQMQRTMAGIR
jgi:arginase family enzyme